MPDGAVTVHGTTIACAGRAALLRGPSGSGKSDLALRCIFLPPYAEGPLSLVADDQTVVTRSGATLVASAPTGIVGLIEVRGIGIVTVPFVASANLHLIIDLVASGEPIERLPERTETMEILGVAVPVLRLHAFEASAPAKVVLALSA